MMIYRSENDDFSSSQILKLPFRYSDDVLFIQYGWFDATMINIINHC